MADKQGYTPYGYGVDKPVVVRSTVSYGRGWQMLRSRGEGSTATGPCDPPQDAADCNCSLTASPPPTDDRMPSCLRTSLCGLREPPPPPPATGARATILLVLDANATNQRFYFGKRDVFGAYSSQAKLAARLLLSLRAVKTTLPIHLLATGVRFPAVERQLSELGATVLPTGAAPAARVPAWASPWARASFAKLAALALGARFERLVVLDNDAVVLRNIDHLGGGPAAAAAPAAVFGWKCHPRRELRAALLVLQPSAAAHTRAQALLDDAATAVYDDNGEGSVWRALYPAGWHELPAGYAALRSAGFGADGWRRAHVLHDPNLLRKAGNARAGWKEAGMAARLRPIDDEAAHVAKGAIEPAIKEQQKAMKAEEKARRAAAGGGGGGGGGGARRRGRRGRSLSSPGRSRRHGVGRMRAGGRGGADLGE